MDMRRREFLSVCAGGAAVAWPFAARAQDKVPRIGFLGVRLPDDIKANREGFRSGLDEHGFVEGRNLQIEYRVVGARYERLPAFAAELVGLGVSLFVTTGGEQVALAAKAASPNIPLVFFVGSDPIKPGLVKSYNQPGTNATGI